MNNIPNQIDIIMDGNVRWSVINNKTPKRLYVHSVFNTNHIISMVENDKILRKDGKIILHVN